MQYKLGGILSGQELARQAPMPLSASTVIRQHAGDNAIQIGQARDVTIKR